MTIFTRGLKFNIDLLTKNLIKSNGVLKFVHEQ